MSQTHLKDLSKVYLENIAEKKDDSYLETDMKKRQANNEKARKDMEKVPGQKNPHFEAADMSNAPSIKDAKPAKETKVKYDPHMKVMAPSVKEALDPVGQEDADIDNDGDTDKSDKYLHKRRKAIRKAMSKRIKESVNLIEVEDKVDDEEKPVKEKKCDNKVKIMPKLGEAIEEIGGVLVESEEIEIVDILEEISDEELIFLSDSMIEEIVTEVFEEALEEGHDLDILQEGIFQEIDLSLALLTEDRYDSAVAASKANARKAKMQKIKSAISGAASKVKAGAKAAYKGAARGAGYVAGAAGRAARTAGSEFKKGYERGSKGSSSSSSGDSESSSGGSSSGGKKKPGMLKRIGSALKRGLKKAVGATARSVSRGARNVARNMGEEVEQIGEDITSEKGKAKMKAMIAARTTDSGRAKPGKGQNVKDIKHIGRANVDGYGGTPSNQKMAKNPLKRNFTGLRSYTGKGGNKAARRAGQPVKDTRKEEVENSIDFNFHHKYTVGEGLLKVDEGMKKARENVGASTCWDGYKAKGTKKKNGREVPNCVKEEDIEEGKKKGLWDNIHAKRKRGEKPAKPGDKDYPKTLNVEGIENARDNVGASKCWKGKKLGTPKTKMKGGKEVPNCVDA